MRRTLGALLSCGALLGGLGPLPARAQPGSSVVDDLQIDLWPEYDRPDVLVMYRFRLRADRSLESPLALPVPASVGEPHAVAWRDPSGALYVAPFTRVVEGDTATVEIQMGSREGQLEFYDDLDVEDGRRTYRFEWPGGVRLGALSFRIQQPAGARELRIDPEPARQWEGEDGLTYASVQLGPQDPSATPAVEVSYVKETEDLTAGGTTTSTVAASAPATPAPSEAAGESGGLPTWAVALFGLGLAGLGGFLMWTSRGSAGATETPRQPKGASAVFCHQCGQKADAGHKFCMSCGTELVKRG